MGITLTSGRLGSWNGWEGSRPFCLPSNSAEYPIISRMSCFRKRRHRPNLKLFISSLLTMLLIILGVTPMKAASSSTVRTSWRSSAFSLLVSLSMLFSSFYRPRNSMSEYAADTYHLGSPRTSRSASSVCSFAIPRR